MLKIQPKDVAELIRRARRAQRKTLERIARDSGVTLARFHRYETEATTRVLSVLSTLGFDLAEQDSQVTLPLPQGLALRRLLHEARQAVLRGDAPPRIILALERVNQTRAGSTLVRGLRAAIRASRANRRGADREAPPDVAAA